MPAANLSLEELLPPLPENFTTLWDHQAPAIKKAVAYFEAGAKVVVLDASPGSGKTLIAEHVRRALGVQGLYLCSTKQLQAQVARSFPYAKIISGRSNYLTLDDFTRTADDCDMFRKGCSAQRGCKPGPLPHCSYCHPASECLYGRAKTAALNAPLAVANTAYAFAEWNASGLFKDFPLVICDEFDSAEQVLASALTVSLSPRDWGRFKMRFPKDGVGESWVRDLAKAVFDVYDQSREDPPDDWPRLGQLAGQLIRAADGLREKTWVVISDDEIAGIEIGPIEVGELGRKEFWPHAQRWLLMSGTVIDARYRLRALGWNDLGTGAGRLVRVPSSYPAKNRPIRIWPVASMVKKHREESIPLQARAIEQILDHYPNERVLIHTGTYAITEGFKAQLAAKYQPRLVTFKQSREREDALSMFLAREGAVLMGPAMERGLDLPDSACAAIIVCRVPYAYQGDRRVAERAKKASWWTYQAIETISSLVQMTGRGFRHRDDRCDSWILDSQFLKIRAHGLYAPRWPSWWTDALESFNGWPA